MKIVFYKSILCPRCALVGLTLKKIAAARPGLHIETVEVAASPLQTWEEGIRMIPAIRCGARILAGFMLSGAAIVSFLDGNRADP
ncbi:MAG: hypothetical protein RQ753_07050 [Desulfurivibrionaceae bacterium]|nr:hypothetical protein [Desulfurivibrionaceae bacterium]